MTEYFFNQIFRCTSEVSIASIHDTLLNVCHSLLHSYVSGASAHESPSLSKINVSVSDSEDELSPTYPNKLDIRASAVITVSHLRQSDKSDFEDYDMQCNNTDLFSLLLLQFCVNIEVLEIFGFHMETISRGAWVNCLVERNGGWRPSLRYAQVWFSPKSHVFSVEVDSDWFPLETT